MFCVGTNIYIKRAGGAREEPCTGELLTEACTEFDVLFLSENSVLVLIGDQQPQFEQFFGWVLLNRLKLFKQIRTMANKGTSRSALNDVD